MSANDRDPEKSERDLLFAIIDKQLEQDQTLSVLSNGLHSLAMDRGRPDIAASIDRDRERRQNSNGAHGPSDAQDTPTNPGIE